MKTLILKHMGHSCCSSFEEEELRNVLSFLMNARLKKLTLVDIVSPCCDGCYMNGVLAESICAARFPPELLELDSYGEVVIEACRKQRVELRALHCSGCE